MSNAINTLRAQLKDLARCGRCSGRGTLVEYVSHNGGVCFECHGAGHCLPRAKKDRAAYKALELKLTAEIEAAAARDAEVAALRTAGETMPDPDTLDLSAILGGVS